MSTKLSPKTPGSLLAFGALIVMGLGWLLLEEFASGWLRLDVWFTTNVLTMFGGHFVDSSRGIAFEWPKLVMWGGILALAGSLMTLAWIRTKMGALTSLTEALAKKGAAAKADSGGGGHDDHGHGGGGGHH